MTLAANASPGTSARRAPDTALLRAAEARRDAYTRDLAALVNLDSGTDDANGLSKVGDVLAARLRELGANVDVRAIPPAAGKFVRGTFQGAGSAKIMLMVHFDTVFGVGEASRRPFKIDGQRAFGPGVADAKGGVAMVLHALAVAKERRFTDFATLTVVFNPDEETGSLGSHEMIRALAADQDYVLSFEPPDRERVIVATNGVVHIQLEVAGRASHAGSAPEKGRNAAVELSGQIVKLNDLGDPNKGTTVNWTRLQSGDRINIIPDKASATADMRFSDVNEIERVERDVARLTKEHVVPDTRIDVQFERRRPAFAKNPSTDRLAALANRIAGELGRSVEPFAARYGTDAGFAYQPGAAKPAILEGLGVVGDRLHSSEEWADLGSVAPRLYLTVRLLEVLGRGERE